MKIFILILIICVFGVYVYASPQIIPVGEQFRDTNGNLLQAHGGGILFYNGYYWWFGENREGNILVSCYRSANMKNWEFRNHILQRSFHSELQDANVERPKVVYNPQTGQFVMWAHKELQTDYSQARACVAVCNTIDGNYTWQRSFRPMNHMSRDCTLFVDDDNRAYFISAANENYDLHIYRLTQDFLDVEELLYIFDGDHREAPAIFKHNGRYFLVTSGATGWNPNQGKYSASTSLYGPWSGWQNFGNATTFESQSTYIQRIQGSQTTSYLYMGDRWAGAWSGPVNDSLYVWLPIQFSASDAIYISYSDSITIDTDTGVLANGEVVFDPNNIAHNKTALASSEEAGNYASHGNDSINGTRWCANDGNTGHWWKVDLGQVYNITQASIMFEYARQYGYIIEGSIDNSNWASLTDQRNSTSTAQTRAHSVNGQARHVRITYTFLAEGTWASHFEFSAYGNTSNNTPVPTPSGKNGDVNSNGTVDIIDALLVAQYYVGLPVTINTSLGDVNCNGSVDIIDALLIAQYYVGLIQTLDC